MTHVFVLLVCALAGVVSAQKDVISLPPATLETALACLAETGVEPEVLVQLLNPNTFDQYTDKKGPKFVNCSLSKLGYAKKNGHLKVDRVLEMFPKDMDGNKRAAVKKVLEECNKENGDNAVETTYKIFGCFVKNSPVKLSPGL